MKTAPNDCAYPADYKTQTDSGLTKREYFAAMAMQGILASGSKQSVEQDAELALESADALINQLNNQ
jgi:GMP synthase-like glutamine amidotransferase